MSDAYDPNAVEDRRSTQYISRRDVRIIGIVLIVLALSAWPIYMYMLRGVHETVCRKHLKRIGNAMIAYSLDYDDRLPYAYEIAGYSGDEMKSHRGLANSWHWAVKPYLNELDVFSCPGANPSSNTRISNDSETMAVSYGMFHAYSGIALGMIPNPGLKCVVSETIKNGLENSYDPLPLTVSGKPVTEDGFVIGFDNTQTYPDNSTRHVTRLAYPDSWPNHKENPIFTEETPTRHPSGINFLYLDGSIRTQKAPAARFSWPGGQYDVPPKPLLISPKPLAP